jgi:hypothetical protein
MACGFSGTHFAGDLNRATEPEQLFGQRGFARVGVGNDGKGATARQFFGDFFFSGRHGDQGQQAKDADYTDAPQKVGAGGTAGESKGLSGQSLGQDELPLRAQTGPWKKMEAAVRRDCAEWESRRSLCLRSIFT